MKIQRIYIATFKKDVYLTKTCVASIRYWYPDIPISLIKDYSWGFFDTSEIEKKFNVDVFDTEKKNFQWGFSKLELLFQNKKERYLVLDSDIVFAGKVINILEEYDEDFIVSSEEEVSVEFLESHYYCPSLLSKIDPEFTPPGYVFNTGQIVATSNILNREDFSPFIKWSQTPSIIYPDVFKLAEQGLLNYILQKKHSQSEITLRRIHFMQWGKSQKVKNIELRNLNSSSSCYPFVIHWAGLKRPLYNQMVNGFILSFFEDYYYSKFSFGKFKKIKNLIPRQIYFYLIKLLRALLGLLGKRSWRIEALLNDLMKKKKKWLTRY